MVLISTIQWRRRGGKGGVGNLTNLVGTKKNKALASFTPSTSSIPGSDESLAKLLVNEYASQQTSFLSMNKTIRNALSKIRMQETKMEQRKFELQHQIFNFQQQKQRHEDELFYMSSIDHLSGIHIEKVL